MVGRSYLGRLGDFRKGLDGFALGVERTALEQEAERRLLVDPVRTGKVANERGRPRELEALHARGVCTSDVQRVADICHVRRTGGARTRIMALVRSTPSHAVSCRFARLEVRHHRAARVGIDRRAALAIKDDKGRDSLHLSRTNRRSSTGVSVAINGHQQVSALQSLISIA